MRFLRRMVGNYRRSARVSAALHEFRGAVTALGPDAVAIDCGANVGVFTLEMAARGATVYAFEPNPYAYAELCRRTREFSNIKCMQRAVAEKPGTVKLFMHERSAEDPLKWSTGSSLVSFKGNVRSNDFVSVVAISLVEFLRELDRPVDMIKIDVEGAEIGILNSLIDAGLHRSIGKIFVEAHDRKIPQLVEPTAALCARLKREGITNINLDWQ